MYLLNIILAIALGSVDTEIANVDSLCAQGLISWGYMN